MSNDVKVSQYTTTITYDYIQAFVKTGKGQQDKNFDTLTEANKNQAQHFGA